MPAPNLQKLPVRKNSEVQSGYQENCVTSTGDRCGIWTSAQDLWKNMVPVTTKCAHTPVHDVLTDKHMLSKAILFIKTVGYNGSIKNETIYFWDTRYGEF